MWINAGHQVMFLVASSRRVEATGDRLGRSPALAGETGVGFGDVMLMAVPTASMANRRDYAKEFIGKIVLDAGNAVLGGTARSAKKARVGVGITTAKYLAGARIVRRSTSWGRAGWHLIPPSREAMAIPIACDDSEAIKVATKLCATPVSSRC